MEQEHGSGDRKSAEYDTSPLDLLDTPVKEASKVLRKLYAESTPLMEDVVMNSGEAQPRPEEKVVDPSDVLYREDMNDRSSMESMKGIPDNAMAQRVRTGLDQYQKYIYTPRSTRSTTQPSRSYQAELEFDKQPMNEVAFSTQESEVPQIQAFAKLEFDDGEFYMNTYSVELGRDLQSARQAAEKTLDPAKRSRSKRRKRSASSGDASHIPRKLKREYNRSHPSSVVSQSGGIIAVDHSDAESLGGYYSKKPASTSSSSQQLSRKSSMLFAPHHTDYQSLAMASLMGSDALRHTDSSNPPLPAPEACPLIPIHPPAKRLSPPEQLAAASNGIEAAEETVGSHKAISRKHVKIAFNFEKHLFEVHVFGRNGAFVDEEYCAAGEVRPLTNGSSMQIGGVSVKFLLPEVAPGETAADRRANSSYASYSEERSSVDSNGNVYANGDRASEDEEDSDTGKTSAQTSPEQKALSKAKAKVQGAKSGKPVKKVSKVEEASPLPKRKGPGRPPKNGVMSKREMGLLAKQAKEDAKAVAKKEVKGELASGKGKSGKTNYEKPQETPSTQPNGKRKYTKRKNQEDIIKEPQGTRESTERTDTVAPEQSVPPKPPKEKKPPKPPRSPSPFIDRNSLTEEQLAKPTQSYVVLIHEALSESERGPMSLNQIYRAIAHKYPYFKFVVTTVGWQSSIRHNLLQHEAFEKIEREGKGWMWGLKPGVSIEKEKKRRPTPPPPQSHQYYPPHMIQHQYGFFSGMPPPPNGQAPYPPHYGAPPHGPPPHGLPQQYPGYPQGYFPPPQRPNGLPLPLLNAATDNSSTYQSPYESKTPTQSLQPNNEEEPHRQQPEHNRQPNTNPPEWPYAPSALTNNASNPQPINQPYQIQPRSGAPPAPHSPTNMSPKFLQAIDRFKSVLMSSIPDKAYGELLSTSAINRVFGSQQHSSLPGRGTGIAEDPQEIAVMHALKNLIPGVVPKEANRDDANERGAEVKTELQAESGQLPASGSLTPGGIAKRLVDDEGAIKGNPETEAKEEPTAIVDDFSNMDPAKAEAGEEGHTSVAEGSNRTEVDSTSAVNVEEPSASAAPNSAQAAEATSTSDQIAD